MSFKKVEGLLVSLLRDGNFYPACGYPVRPGLALMGWILPSPIKNRVGFGFLKKKTRSRFGLGPGFYKNPADSPTRLNIYIYIYIVITLTKIPHLTHNLFRLQSHLSSLSLQLTTLTHSPLPLSLTLLSCLTLSASLML